MKFTGERVTPNLYNLNKSLYNWHLSRYNFARRFLLRNDNVLDVACGTGYGAYELSPYVKKIIGVDIDPETIEFASKMMPAPNIEFRLGSVTKLNNIINEKFNIVLSFETIEHLDEQEQIEFIKRILYSLNKDGIVLMSTPNKKIYSPKGKHNYFHKKEFTLEEYRKFLTNYFEQVFILGQTINKMSQNKRRIMKISQILGTIKNGKIKLKINNNEFDDINDYEFSNRGVEDCLYFMAVCKHPKF